MVYGRNNNNKLGKRETISNMRAKSELIVLQGVHENLSI